MTEPKTAPIAVPAAPAGLTAPIAFGTFLVGYSFLGGLWLNRHGYSPAWLVTVREWLNKPLGLGEDFGFLGIALLLMSGGYLLASRAATRPLPAFVGQLVRYALPAAGVAVVLGVLFGLLGDPLPLDTFSYRANPLLFAVLAGAVFAVLSLIPPRSAVTVLLQLGVVVLAHVVAAFAGLNEFGILMSLVVLPICGSLLWLNSAGLAKFWDAAPLMLICLATLVVSEHVFREAANWWFPVATVCALMLMMLAVRGSTRPFAPFDWLAGRSFPLVLLCGVLGYPVLSLLNGMTPLLVNYVVALLVWGFGAELLHRWSGKSA